MDKEARWKETSAEERRGLYELYLRRMDRIDDWGLVDLGAQYVVGGYLHDQPRDVLSLPRIGVECRRSADRLR